MADHDDRVLVDGDERVLREGEPLVRDVAGFAVASSASRYPSSVSAMWLNEVVDRGFGYAVGDQLIAREPDLMMCRCCA